MKWKKDAKHSKQAESAGGGSIALAENDNVERRRSSEVREMENENAQIKKREGEQA